MEVEDNERFFNDFVSRINLSDTHTIKIDIDLFRQQYPSAA